MRKLILCLLIVAILMASFGLVTMNSFEHDYYAQDTIPTDTIENFLS